MELHLKNELSLIGTMSIDIMKLYGVDLELMKHVGVTW